MQPNVPLEFQHLYSVEPLENEPTKYFDKFFADVQLQALGIDTDKLDKETAVIDAPCKKLFDSIAAKVTGATSQTLAKNSPAPATQKVARIEVTKYLHGGEVVAELNERGEVI